MAPPLPRISIVTPSFNQGAFLERAMRSVLDQAYGELEYVVVDGGSKDGSVEIVRRHADRLAWWTSEPDAGQYDALNKGFARTSGEIMAWLNSDDMYVPGALSMVAEIFAAFPQVEWLTTLFPLWWDERDRPVLCSDSGGYTGAGFLRGEHLGGTHFFKSFIQQESTFWRRSLWDRAGGRLDAAYDLAGDFELWARFFAHAELFAVAAPLAGFRGHPGQKTARDMEGYLAEAAAVLRAHGGRLRGPVASLLRRVGERLPLAVAGPFGLKYRAPLVLWDVRDWCWSLRR